MNLEQSTLGNRLDSQLGEGGNANATCSHIPHGFYEHQMKAYFSQFGAVTKLRMARNKRTGASKHFAFVEFESDAVADIVARTMNKYLMFNHILEVRVVPQDQLHPNLWKNHSRRFKIIPRGPNSRPMAERAKE